jgi:predicted dehydrogenase
MAARLADCVALVQAAEKHGRLLQIAHVLRYTDFFPACIPDRAVRNPGADRYGITPRKRLRLAHGAQLRARQLAARDQASPMILAKSCHDLDILYWILGNQAKTLTSVGGLKHFRPENAPAGAPQRCLDGCPAAESCPFYAPAIYMELEPIYEGLANAHNTGIRLVGKLMQRSPAIVRAAAKAIPTLRQITEFAVGRAR